MLTDAELGDAVAAGAITAADAEGLRQFVNRRRQAPHVDEEDFRLVTSFNDIFVALAAIIALVAAGSLAGGLGLAAASWPLAEFFTRRRRMALPSIILLLAFVAGVSAIAAEATSGGIGAGLLGAGAAYVHWLRFRVPITVAAGAATLTIMWMGFFKRGDSDELLFGLLVAGILIFAAAMWWDRSDRTRITRRSDVAFWLHLLASPLLVHPIFWLTGLARGSTTPGGAAAVIGVYVMLSLIALAIDRRALLVSALAYVLFALGSLIVEFGTIGTAVPMTALVISSALLLLSAFWHRARSALVARLPASWQEQLPVISLDWRATPQPAA